MIFMEHDIYQFIDALEKEINKTQKRFFDKWNYAIRNQFQLNAHFHIENYVDLFGGYWLSQEAFQTLEPALKHFYAGCTVFEGRVYLRGYDYYQADLVLNLYSQRSEHHRLWQTFQTKWMKYLQLNDFSFINRRMCVENWIGTLGVLEYMFSDLTSIRWFIFRNEKMLQESLKEQFGATIEDLEVLTELTARSIAALLKFRFDEARELLTVQIGGLIRSKRIICFLESNFQSIEKASIRTMREGDSLAIIYAAYLLRLEPFCRKERLTHIHIMSNAFGAMNIGILLKHMMPSNCHVHHTNILYAQHRSDGDFVYDDTLINRCVFINSDGLTDYNKAQAVFVVDDSICFGKSYHFIKNFLERESVYLLPMTLNCNGMKYFRGGLTEQDDLGAMIRQSVFWAGEVNQELPAFFSFWDFRRSVPADCPIEDPNYRFAMFGSDLLLRHLWTIYLHEILCD